MDSIINHTAFFVISKGKPGGAERRFYYLYEHFINKNKLPYLITNSELFDSLSPDSLSKKNVFKTRLNCYGVFGSLKYILDTLRYIRNNNIKHVHFCVNPSVYSFLMINILKLFGCTTSVSIVNSIIRQKADLPRINRFFWRKTIQSVNHIDVLSPSIKKNMINLFGSVIFPDHKVSISACSFSMRSDFLSKDKRCNGNVDNRPYDFLFASRLIEGKGLELLLDTLKMCDEEGHKIVVGVCGVGPLAEKVKDLNFNYVQLKYLGYIKNMHEILFLSKVALSLQRYENYPSQFLLEALAANCHIISTDVGDTRLLLNDDIATLIESDVISLKDALLNITYDCSTQRIGTVKNVLNMHTVDTFSKYIERSVLGAKF
ncbi:glycosyltransferase [Vibrio splendidus]